MALDDIGVATRTTAGVTFAARLIFEDICHSFSPGSETLADVSLAAEPGEVLCLLGPSGSGKTTLLRIAAGIEPQTTGRVLLNGREIAGPSVFLPPEKRSIGLVFQDFALFPHMTILDNVRFGLTATVARGGAARSKDRAVPGRAGGLRRLISACAVWAASNSASRSPAHWRRVRRCF